MAAAITPLAHTLAATPLSWTQTQEKALSKDFPFAVPDETPDAYVIRTYLQFLWLPESIMPLGCLIPALQRVAAASPSTSTAHPLHALLDPLLLTTRATTTKYHVELPRILDAGGGAGEIEETAMWFALHYEKAGDSDRDRARSHSGEGAVDALWTDHAWRQKWLERLERREVQIQILLYFLKLSLPGPSPTGGDHGLPTKKRKRSAVSEAKPSILSTKDHLEAFMDKLSTWQLMVSMSEKPPQKLDPAARDWMQTFFETTVAPHFSTQLPEMCDLLRTKIFPHSPFAGDAPPDARSPSPDLHLDRRHQAPPHALGPASDQPDTRRVPAPAPAHSTAPRPRVRADDSRGADATRALARARSRSLSVSLAQEREQGRAGSVGAKKRVLNREVSMSRVFKGKPRAPTPAAAKDNGLAAKDRGTAGGARRAEMSAAVDEGVTLVVATPVKGSRSLGSFANSRTGTLGTRGISRLNFGPAGAEEEEIWELPSSPDVLLLGEGGQGEFSEGELTEIDEDGSDVDATPTKKGKRGR